MFVTNPPGSRIPINWRRIRIPHKIKSLCKWFVVIIKVADRVPLFTTPFISTVLADEEEPKFAAYPCRGISKPVGSV